MSAPSFAVSDMTITVKSREVQRALLAEMRGDRPAAARHFLAAAHLELVLADDYARGGLPDLAFRSRLGSASCFWRAGRPEQARPVFEDLLAEFPDRAAEVRDVITDLEQGDRLASVP